MKIKLIKIDLIYKKIIFISSGYFLIIANRGLAFIFLIALTKYNDEYSVAYSSAQLALPFLATLLAFNSISIALTKQNDDVESKSEESLHAQQAILSIIFIIINSVFYITKNYNLNLISCLCYFSCIVEINYTLQVLKNSKYRILIQNIPYIFLYLILYLLIKLNVNYYQTINTIVIVSSIISAILIYKFKNINLNSIKYKIKQRMHAYIGSFLESLMPAIALILLNLYGNKEDIVLYNIKLSTLGLLSAPMMILLGIYTLKMTQIANNSRELYKLILIISWILSIIAGQIFYFFSKKFEIEVYTNTHITEIIMISVMSFEIFLNAITTFILNVKKLNNKIIHCNIILILSFIIISQLLILININDFFYAYFMALTIRSIYQYKLLEGKI